MPFWIPLMGCILKKSVIESRELLRYQIRKYSYLIKNNQHHQVAEAKERCGPEIQISV